MRSLMRILIVEDEPVHARFLSSLLSEILGSEIETMQHQKTLTAAECFLLDNSIDLLFLDLNLYGENGFDLLQIIGPLSFSTIVVSAHEDMAVQAFDQGVLDFIPKPVSQERLKKALTRFQDNRFASRRWLEYFSYSDRGELVIVPLKDIIYFNASGKQLIIHTTDGNKRTCSRQIGEVENLIPSSFRRIHKSYIVNSHTIRRLLTSPGGKYAVTLTDGSELPVSRQLYSEIKQWLASGLPA
jgi:two-component system, LytTR family, response regulator LytT